MYSESLEAIIDAALADGVLSDKEREVLHKRAAQEGIDADELDVVIEGRLAKKKKEEDWLRPAPPQNLVNEKLGNVVKCPNCGCTDVAGRALCPECGYAFSNVKTNSSAERLAEQLAKIESARRGDLLGGIASGFGGGKAGEKASCIQNFPVPNTREDLLEFLSMLKPKSSRYGKYGMTQSEATEAKACYVKYVECIEKAQRSFRDDPDFQPFYEFYNKERKKRSPIFWLLIIGGSFWVILIIIIILGNI